MRVEICASDDSAGIVRLLAALTAEGAMFDDFLDGDLGVGLSTFRIGENVLTVFRDAWMVDLHGPDELVKRIVELLSSNAEYTTPR